MPEKANGYILLHRSLMDHWLWQDEVFTKGQAWVDLLLMANYKPGQTTFNGQVCQVGRGERVTSYSVLAGRWHWSKSSVKRFLEKLEAEGMITITVSHRQTIIKIIHYDDYQSPAAWHTDGAKSGTPKAEKRHSEKAEAGTVKEAVPNGAEAPSKQGLAGGEQAADETIWHTENEKCGTPKPQKRHTESRKVAHEYKEDNNTIKNNIPPLSPQGEREDWHARFEKELADKLDGWLAYKQEKRQTYKAPALQALLERAEKMAAEYGSDAVIAVIDYSMSNNYQGIVWDKLAGGCAGTKTAGEAGTKTSRSRRQPYKENYKSEERDLNFLIDRE